MIQRTRLIALFFLLLGLLIPLSNASWSFIPSYIHAYNISVNNWNYTASNNFHSLSTFVLVNLTNVGQADYISILGYSKSQQNLGAIPYFIVNQVGNRTLLLLYYKTNQSQIWNTATIYYDSVYTTVPTYQGPIPSLGLQNYSYNYKNSSQSFSLIGTNYTIDPGLSSISQLFTPPGSNSITLGFNFTSYTQRRFYGYNSSFILISNRSLLNRSFNINWYSSISTGYKINTTNTGYQLTGLQVFNLGAVYNSPVVSPHANEIFNNISSGTGFEGWFYSSGNQIATEGMAASTNTNCVVYNSIIPKYCGVFNIYSYPNTFFLTINTNAPTSYVLMPAFTTNYTISNSLTNNAPSINATVNKGFFYNYLYRIPIDNINWSYRFISNAMYQNPEFPFTTYNAPLVMNFTSGQVPYLILNITHYSEMGPYCDDINFRDYNNQTNTDYGSIPFYILNCTPTNSKASFLLANKTSLGYAYNSTYLYYDTLAGTCGTSPEIQSYSNSTLYHNYAFKTGSIFNFTIDPTTNSMKPFMINTMRPLSTINFINLSSIIWHESGTSDQLHTQNGGNVNASSTNRSTSFIFAFEKKIALPNGIADIVSATPNLAYACQHSNYQFFANYTYGIQQFADCNNNQTFNVILTNNYGSAHYLSTSNYIIGNAESNPCIIKNFTGLPSTNSSGTLPNSTNHLIYNGTTTIVFNSLSNLQTITPGVTLPKYDFLIIAIIIFLLSGLTFAIDRSGQLPFALFVIALWVMSVWEFPILILAIILTMVFIIYEYIEHRVL